MTVVLHRHCRELDYCNRGMRAWFKREGLDWAEFLRNGIAAERLKQTNNAMADRAIAHAEGEARGRIE